MKKINHIGIAVPHLEEAVAQYQTLGFDYRGSEAVASQKVNTAFFRVGESMVELLEPSDPDSVIAKFLQNRGPGIHHLCVEVDNIEETMAAYKRAGLRLVNPEPVIGAGGHRVAFVHPKSAGGVLIEIIETETGSVPDP